MRDGNHRLQVVTRWPRGYSRIMSLMIGVFLQFAFIAPSLVVYSEAAMQVTTSGSHDSAVELLFPEVAGGTDEFGRATLFRLTFHQTAGVGPEDLPTPFIAYVESGSFTHRDASGTYADIETGAVLRTSAGDDYAIRNADIFSQSTLLVIALPGSCRIYLDQACMPHFLPYDFLCETPCRPDVTNTLLFPQQSIVHRLMPVMYSVHKVNLQAGEEFEAFDFGGKTEAINLMVRVDAGSVQTTTGETYIADSVFAPLSGETITSTDVTELLVIRIAEIP